MDTDEAGESWCARGTIPYTVSVGMMIVPGPEGATDTTIVQVLQPGFKQHDRVLRAARVSVADPQ